MFYYKNELTLNSKFNKSTNILHDKEECSNYIITQSTKDTLHTLFKLDYHNSIALIGPFGCGKSSLLLYINTLVAQSKESEICLKKIKQSDKELYKAYRLFIENRNFLRIKIVGEHISFKLQFKDALLQHKVLKRVNLYLKESESFVMSKALKLLNEDLKKTEYSDTLISIDEFGKFIEYGLEEGNDNDIFDLQTVAEYVNKQSNYKLIISLHKAFGEYINTLSEISYTDWDKIQGRFENIVFRDDYYEMLNIFKETIVLQESKYIEQSQQIIKQICENSILQEKSENFLLFKQITPIDPFSAIVISEIFTRYFQNHRSVFSFLFSTEPYAFGEFISKKLDKVTLYSLSNLYDYVSYLLKVYSILLPDRELWYVAEYRLRDNRVQDDIKQDIIKTIALIHTFKLTNILKSDKNNLTLSLISRYTKKSIIETIEALESDNIILFQEQTQSYSLLEDSNININKELQNRIEQETKIDFEKQFNRFILDKIVIAKRYFIEYGSQKRFEKIYVSNSKKILEREYKIFYSSMDKKELITESKDNDKSLFIPLNNISKLEILIKKIEALEDISIEFSSIISIETKEIISNMISDYSISLEKLFKKSCYESYILYKGEEYSYNQKQIQKLISDIAQRFYPDAPKINNFNFNHTIKNKATNTTAIKKLFEAMLEQSDKRYLGIDKYPAQKALYLSVIEVAGIHQETKDGKWRLSKPNNLNFEKSWMVIEKELSQKALVEDIIIKLSKEPYGLNTITALFIISLYIIVNRERVHIIQDNTYKYTLTIDLLMNIWKATPKYRLQRIELNQDEAKLFKAYIEITTNLTEYEYSTTRVLSIIRTLHNKFTLLPDYAKNTQKLSSKAVALRSAIISMKEPKEAFFSMFPKALGYDSIENISNDEFSRRFKQAFNEIALAYKKEIVELEKFFAEIFHFETHLFPYGGALVKLSEKLSSFDTLDRRVKTILRGFTYSNSFHQLINSLSMTLINKKLENCYDNDIVRLKSELKKSASDILSKLELADVATKTKDVRKISLASLNSNFNQVISIDKQKLDKINKKAFELKNMIPNDYSNDEKLFLISQLLNGELNNG